MKKKLVREQIIKKIKTFHNWHLVDPSPWPLSAALGSFFLTFGGVMYMHGYSGGKTLILIGFITIMLTMFLWFRDIVRESTYEKKHTILVQKGLRLGMILFLISETMFFFSFFWAFFHSSLSPVFNIGGVWPPEAIQTINIYGLPLTNTIILLSSGVSLTWAHNAILIKAKKHVLVALMLTIFLGFLFTFFQLLEYKNASFTISDGIFGSCFYLTTGFHGLHVIIGSFFLVTSFIRVILNHFTNTQHLGFEFSIWYWHFVDVIWLLLFISFYWWGV